MLTKKDIRYLLKYTFLFFLLFTSIATASYLKIVNEESNPFFYENF
jgi:hypothetical protein